MVHHRHSTANSRATRPTSTLRTNTRYFESPGLNTLFVPRILLIRRGIERTSRLVLLLCSIAFVHPLVKTPLVPLPLVALALCRAVRLLEVGCVLLNTLFAIYTVVSVLCSASRRFRGRRNSGRCRLTYRSTGASSGPVDVSPPRVRQSAACRRFARLPLSRRGQ